MTAVSGLSVAVNINVEELVYVVDIIIIRSRSEDDRLDKGLTRFPVLLCC